MKQFIILLSIVVVVLVGHSLTFPAAPPPGAIGPYLDGKLPSQSPGLLGQWELVDIGTTLNIASPVGIINIPDSEDLLILSKTGKIHQVGPDLMASRVVLDISAKTFYLTDAGALGIALHPRFGDAAFPDKQLLYVYYKTKPDASEWDLRGFSVLSSFKYNSSQGVFDPGSEYKFIQQYDRHPWHNGGSMLFGKDGLLYFAVGDEGADEFQSISTQRLDGGFFNGVFRIDVDNDSTRSHPIRRQPQSYGPSPVGWGATFTQGYSIPNDNPWQSESGAILEEYWAIGTRSPFGLDIDEETGDLWICDVGSSVREEINKVRKKDNLQWPYKEGRKSSDIHDSPLQIIGSEKEPYFEYPRSEGGCVVGGTLYDGPYEELEGHFLFGDFIANTIKAIPRQADGNDPEPVTIVGNIDGFNLDLPVKPGITGVHTLADGRLVVTVIGEDFNQRGNILELRKKVLVGDPDSKLSSLGVFTDMEKLTTRPGIIPYRVNSPLWSDGAIKNRWMVLANDGTFDSPTETVRFVDKSEWDFPAGTVFIKHFSLPLSDDDEPEVTKLETRFFVITEQGGYGLTYRWDEDGKDATLLTEGETRSISVERENVPDGVQVWEFPSREQCLTCHTPNSKYVLGVNTHQLNGDLRYPLSLTEVNQLEYLNSQNIFSTDIGVASKYSKAYNVVDADVELEPRIRSYLDSNCSSCHRFGGVPTVDLDFRYSSASNLGRYLNFASQSHASPSGSRVIVPGDHSISELWIRDSSTEDNKMPPIGRAFVDQVYVDSLAKWIDNINIEDYRYHDIIVYPNPTVDWLSLQLPTAWEPPYQVSLTTVTGRPIRYFNLEEQFLAIDMRDYAQGMYLLTVVQGDRRVVQKVMKQ